MYYLLEILCDLISRDSIDYFFSKNHEKYGSYESLFYLWDIESEADDAEIENLVKQGIITKEDGNILKVHRRQILVDLQTIVNNVEELNLSKRESIKMV